jgi:hypothetical protein
MYIFIVVKFVLFIKINFIVILVFLVLLLNVYIGIKCFIFNSLLGVPKGKGLW